MDMRGEGADMAGVGSRWCLRTAHEVLAMEGKEKAKDRIAISASLAGFVGVESVIE